MTTLSNSTAVLRMFAPDRLEVTVTDVCRQLGMPKSTASRLLKAMREEGLLSRSENSTRYKVGNLLFEIARLYRLNSPLIEVVDDALKALSRETGHTGYISILDGADVLVIRMHQGSHALQVFTPLGHRAAAFATANGRALLARLPDERVRALHAEGLVPPSPSSPKDVESLLAVLARVRGQGWEEANDEAIAGVGSVASSVTDPETGETLGFCLSFPVSNVPKAERKRIAALVTTAARRIASRFGDPFFSQFIRVVPEPGAIAA